MLYLVFEYLDTDLKKYMDTHGQGPGQPIDLATVKVSSAVYIVTNAQRERVSITRFHSCILQNFMYQLCIGVAHCHSHGVMHR